jgi:beta-lactam-binding protein with PASTA domain
VTTNKGAKAATGKVVGQSRKPETALPAGTVVKVTLGKGCGSIRPERSGC